jgi:hypothetical protein
MTSIRMPRNPQPRDTPEVGGTAKRQRFARRLSSLDQRRTGDALTISELSVAAAPNEDSLPVTEWRADNYRGIAKRKAQRVEVVRRAWHGMELWFAGHVGKEHKKRGVS